MYSLDGQNDSYLLVIDRKGWRVYVSKEYPFVWYVESVPNLIGFQRLTTIRPITKHLLDIIMKEFLLLWEGRN